MTVAIQCFAAFGLIALCALASWIVVEAKEDFKFRKMRLIIQYDRPLTIEEISSIRANLREQGLHGALIIGEGTAKVVWPPPPVKDAGPSLEECKNKFAQAGPFPGVPHVPQPQSKDADDCLKKVERAVRASKKV